jgi:hypothetical protein
MLLVCFLERVLKMIENVEDEKAVKKMVSPKTQYYMMIFVKGEYDLIER